MLSKGDRRGGSNCIHVLQKEARTMKPTHLALENSWADSRPTPRLLQVVNLKRMYTYYIDVDNAVVDNDS